ncbi:MAG: hypothetical protein ACLPSW_32185, partial [Roseiarcus sp.]
MPNLQEFVPAFDTGRPQSGQFLRAESVGTSQFHRIEPELRTPAKLTASFGGSRTRADGVVPFRMEQVGCDIEGLHLGVA